MACWSSSAAQGIWGEPSLSPETPPPVYDGRASDFQQVQKREEPRMDESIRSTALWLMAASPVPRNRVSVRQFSDTEQNQPRPGSPRTYGMKGKTTQLGGPQIQHHLPSTHPLIHQPTHLPSTQIKPHLRAAGAELCQQPEGDWQQTLLHSLQVRASWWHLDLS